MRQPYSIDWSAVLDDIAHCLGEPDPLNPDVRVRCSSQVLADELGVPRGTLRRWLDGAEPRHTDGEQVLVVWCRLTSKAREFAPKERRQLSAACF